MILWAFGGARVCYDKVMKIFAHFTLLLFIFTTVFATVFATVFSGHAKANIFVFEDERFGITISFPDTWRVQQGNAADDVILIRQESGLANAQCQIKAHTDRRFIIYPRRYLRDILARELGPDYWTGQLSNFENAEVVDFNFLAGFGRGDASYVKADFIDRKFIDPLEMRGIFFASIYGPVAYMAFCAAERDRFEALAPLMGSIISSVGFPKSYDETLTGDYRSFLSSGKMRYPFARGLATIEY